MKIARTLQSSAVIALCAVFSGACANPSDTATYTKQARVIESQSHLAGAELAQQTHRMQRAHKDLVEYHRALVTLKRRDDSSGIEAFRGFIEPYMADHVDAQLSQRNEAWNDELTTLDANLLFAKAELQRGLDDYWGLQATIREIRRRYGDQNDLLVEYPFGERNTLASALKSLRYKR